MLYISKREIIHIRTCILFWTTKILRINTVLEKKTKRKTMEMPLCNSFKKTYRKRYMNKNLSSLSMLTVSSTLSLQSERTQVAAIAVYS